MPQRSRSADPFRRSARPRSTSSTPTNSILHHVGCDRAVRIVSVIVARQRARFRTAVIGDSCTGVGGNYVHIEIDQTLARDGCRSQTHAVRRVTSGTREACVDVGSVLVEGGIQDYVIKVMAFGAKGIRTGARIRTAAGSQDWIGEKILDRCARPRGWRSPRRNLAELIAPYSRI